MIAGDEESAVARTQPAQAAPYVAAELAHRTVDHISGHRDEIGAQPVDRIHDGLDIIFADRRCRRERR